MSIEKNKTIKIIKDFGSNETDSGSADVQVAILTERIKNLTEHFKTHNKDNHSKRGLVALVNKRKKLLDLKKLLKGQLLDMTQTLKQEAGVQGHWV